MINLLPPHLKDQKKYAQRNRQLLSVMAVSVWLMFSIASALVASWYVIYRNQQKAEQKLEEQAAQSKRFGSIEQDAKTLADRLGSIEKIQGSQTHFSRLLNEVAAMTPSGVYLSNLQVGSEANSTMKISAYAETEQAAASFKNALEKSSRFSSAALQNLDADKDPFTGKSTYRLNLVVGLKEGALK